MDGFGMNDFKVGACLDIYEMHVSGLLPFVFAGLLWCCGGIFGRALNTGICAFTFFLSWLVMSGLVTGGLAELAFKHPFFFFFCHTSC